MDLDQICFHGHRSLNNATTSALHEGSDIASVKLVLLLLSPSTIMLME